MLNFSISSWDLIKSPYFVNTTERGDRGWKRGQLSNLIYKFTWSSRLWRDVLLHNHFLCFCCGTGHREKHFRLELAPSGNSFDFYTTVRSFIRSSVTRRFDPLTVSTMPILQPPRNESQRPILLRICFFFYLFFGFVFSEKSKATYLFFF
jgi:hypothetical protein